MARRRDQAGRRQELVTAARRVAERKGLGGAQLRDVAEAAGLTPGAVLYYYGGLDELFLEVYDLAIERFCAARERVIAAEPDPVAALAAVLELAVPAGPDDPDLKLLFEFDALVFRDPAYVRAAREYLGRQFVMYGGLLARGAAAGAFALAADPDDVARNLVALEDAHGYSVLLGDLEPAAMRRLLLDHAAAATGVDLGAAQASSSA